MKLHRMITRKVSPTLAVGAVCTLSVAACGGGGSGGNGITSEMAATTTSGLTDTALVSNKDGVVATTTTIDDNLSNPRGLATAPGLPFWIADNSNLATLYSGKGAIQTNAVTGLTTVGVTIPTSATGVQANPTGQVYNGTGDFLIPTNNGQEPALFIFDGEGGTIAAWAKDSGASAVTAYDDGVTNGANHAVYKGLAMGTVSGTSYLYATDLHNGKVDVFDTNFSKPANMQGKFVDPTMPSGFVPFGIASLNGQLYISYAMRDTALHDEVAGAGLGYVDVFDFNGNFISRFASADALNAPWGMALAPAGFGSFEGDLLIGNFGDGTINAFAPNGTALATSMGPLTGTAGGPLSIPGLWSLVFGNGDSDKPVTTLFYTAGFANQTDGVFGTISATSTTSVSPAPTGY